VHGDGVGQGDVASVVIKVEAQINRITKRQNCNSSVADVDG